jgi:hypothetical protein
MTSAWTLARPRCERACLLDHLGGEIDGDDTPDVGSDGECGMSCARCDVQHVHVRLEFQEVDEHLEVFTAGMNRAGGVSVRAAAKLMGDIGLGGLHGETLP